MFDSTGCSSRRLKFGSQDPHAGTQPPVTQGISHIIESSRVYGIQHTNQLSHTHDRVEGRERVREREIKTFLKSSQLACCSLSVHKSS